MHVNEITKAIIGAALSVHRELGPGLLESTYQACLQFEIRRSGLFVERQKALPIVYKGIMIDAAYRIDMLVERTVIVEIKGVEQLSPVHSAQLLTYLKLSHCPVGLLINFNTLLLRDGLRRLSLKDTP